MRSSLRSGEHSTIEFGNRVFALFPIVLTLLAWIAAPRTPGLGRWVIWAAALVFLGTIAQAPLGLLTIRLDLHPLMVRDALPARARRARRRDA